MAPGAFLFAGPLPLAPASSGERPVLVPSRILFTRPRKPS
jgi:hypothetical protein